MGKDKYRSKSGETRSEQEKSENLTTERIDAPHERFQTEQQINSTSSSADTKTPDTSFQKKTVKAGGGMLRQEVASEVLDKATGSQYGVDTPSKVGLKSISFSGDTGTLLGDFSGTPIMDRSAQGKTRVDKRLSDANKDINYLASEQVAVEYQNIPPLAKSDKRIGYNGNPKNIAARSQKKTGLTSAELLYDRSLDFLEDDGFVFTTGQVVKQAGVATADYPTVSYEYGEYEDQGVRMEGWHKVAFNRTRGNFSPRELVVKVKKDNGGLPYISSFDFNVDDYSANGEDYETVNRSSTNHKIDMNRAELARQTIDQDAGSPSSEHFNALGRSVEQPTRTIAYLADEESSVGATIFAAYKFAQKARGHYLNRTAKDGQDLTGPAIDALYGHLINASSRAQLLAAYNPDGDDSALFSTDGIRNGSAALMIKLFDSVGKYKTKADLITQPRGFKLHYQTADNNMDPFKCKKEFIAALNSIDVYSTIDRGYDPMSCVCIMDNVRLVYPYNFHEMLNYTRSAYGAERNYGSKLFTYYYSAGSGNNTFYIKCAEPLLNGLAWFFELHANELYRALKKKTDADGEFTLTVPCVHSTTHFSLWDLLILAATPYVIYERTNTMKDILDYEQFYKYPLQGLVSIKEANPMNAVNYGNPSALEPLQIKQMLPSSAIRWTWKEKFSSIGQDLMMPFYFNEDSYLQGGTSSNPTITDNGEMSMSTPVVRSGLRLGFVDDFFGMEIDDVLLCYDTMVRIPGTLPGSAVAGYIYKYSQDAEGIPVVRNSVHRNWTFQTLHATPRMLGWFMPAYAGECCAYGAAAGDAIGYYPLKAATLTDPIHTETSAVRAVMYKGVYTGEGSPVDILDPGSVNVSRGQAFTQYWTMRRASGTAGSIGTGFDLCLSVGQGITNANTPVTVPTYTLFKPYTYSRKNNAGAGNKYANGPYLFSPHRAFWAVVQKLPFVLNPFDDVYANVDPFGFAYLFNLAGFMSANYDEMEYDRQSQVQNQDFGYTSDPFVAASPVFKDAYAKTQIG